MRDFDLSIVWPDLEIMGRLGGGPFGDVYLAKAKDCEDEALNAVKIITMPPDGYNKLVAEGKRPAVNFAKYQNDLTWEMTMFKAADAPGLIKPEEMFLRRNPDDTGWVCASRMKLYIPLADYFGKKVRTADVVRMGRELCSIIESYANLGLVHGDIKPENVFVDDNGNFLIGDFGIKRCLAKAGTADLTQSSAYDAPEVETYGRYYAVSDLYSLGMTMAYLLNGCSMPTGKNINLIKCKDPELIKIIKKAVSYDPKDRYRSAGDMMAALDRLTVKSKPHMRNLTARDAALDKINRPSIVVIPDEEFPEERRGRITAFFRRIRTKMGR